MEQVRHFEFSSSITVRSVRDEVANFCAVMDSLIDQDAGKEESNLVLCCLITPGLRRDIRCHVWLYFFLFANHQGRH